MTPYESRVVSPCPPLPNFTQTHFGPPSVVSTKASNSLEIVNEMRASDTAGSENLETPDTMSYFHTDSERPASSSAVSLALPLTSDESRTTNLRGGTALHRAVFNGHESVVITLLRAGANVEVCEESA